MQFFCQWEMTDKLTVEDVELLSFFKNKFYSLEKLQIYSKI